MSAGEKIFEAITGIRDDIIESAGEYDFKRKKKSLAWIGFAAAACLVLGAAAFGVSRLIEKPADPHEAAVPTAEAPEKTASAEFNGVEEPPTYETFFYENYLGLFRTLCDKDSAEHAEMAELCAAVDIGPYFRSYAESLADGTARILAPTVDGSIFELTNEREEPIVVFTKEKFNLPWIWYFCSLEGNEIVIEVCDLNAVLPEALLYAQSYSEVSKLLAPKYATADTDPKEYADTFVSVEEREITLNNGEKVMATVFRYKQEVYPGRVCYRFLTNGVIVSAWNWTEDDHIDDAFFTRFGLKELTAENAG